MTDEPTRAAIAVDAIEHTLVHRAAAAARRSPDLRPELAAPGATFVTLERDGALLGCIGALERAPAARHRRRRARASAAAFDDPRLPPIDASTTSR